MPFSTRNIRRKIDQVFKRHDDAWSQTTAASLGDESGVVPTGVDGMVYARLRNGETIEVFNDVAPERAGLKVKLGRRKEEPTLWRVISWRNAYSKPQVDSGVKHHHKQHEFLEEDEVPINRKQILQLTIRVKSAEDFTVQVYGGQATTPGGIVKVKHAVVDLSSFLPATGGIYVATEFDDSGTISTHAGTGFDAPAIGSTSYIPVPDAGKYHIGSVLLFEGMEILEDKYIYVPMPVWTDYTGLSSGTQIHDASEETTLANDDEFGFWQAVSETIKKITWANMVATLTTIFDSLYATIDHTHEESGGGGHLHGLARWNGASGQTTFDLPDVWEYIDSLMLNGLEEDPLVYSLSTDGTQVVLDSALPTDMTITAHGVIATV